MGQNDYLTEPTAPSVSGTDIVINPGQQQPSQGTRFLSTFVQGLMKGSGSDDKMKKEKDKLTYYTELRKAGYSPDEASVRVNKQYSGGFLNKILGKTAAGFSPPSGSSDMITDDQEKKAKFEHEQAATAYLKKKTDTSGTSGKSGTGNTERMKELSSNIVQMQHDMKKGKVNKEDLPQVKKDLEEYKKAYKRLLLMGSDDEDSASGSVGKTPAGQPGKSGGFYMIRVKRKSDGATGLLNQDEFNDQEYERIS